MSAFIRRPQSGGSGSDGSSGKELQRTARPTIAPYGVERPLTASATKITIGNKLETEKLKRRRANDRWQDEAWEYYDAIGEVKYAFGLVGAVASRVRLYAACIGPSSAAPSAVDSVLDLPDGLADASKRALARLNSSHGGQPGLLRSAAINLMVAGECYLVQTFERIGSGIPESWDIRSVDEIIVNAGGDLSLKTSRAQQGQGEPMNPDAFVARIWRAHPRYSDEADSSMRAVRDDCDALLLLNRVVRATARSRLNAGMLFVPDGLSVAAAADEDDTQTIDGADVSVPTDTDEFEDQLVDAMTSPINDESSAASVVPLIVRGPTELGKEITHITFERAYDDALAARASETLDRILNGLDVPKDVVAGLRNLKFAVSDDTYMLTRRGWKLRTELVLGEDVLTLNHETGLSEWQPLLAITPHDVDENVLVMSGTKHSSITTLDHRWPVIRERKHKYGNDTRVEAGERIFGILSDHDPRTVDRQLTNHKIVRSREWTTSRETGSGAQTDYVITAAPCADLPTQPKYSDEFVEVVAWFYTEGSISRSTAPGVRMTGAFGQTERIYPENVARIRRALVGLCGPERLSLRDVRVPAWREKKYEDIGFSLFSLTHEVLVEIEKIFVGERFDKVVSLDFIHSLTAAQLQLFVDVSIAADGHGTSTEGSLFQKLPERLDACELACALLGITTRRTQNRQRLTITRKSATARIPREALKHYEPYKGIVWCPTTSNGTWFAKHNDKSFFTGNSNAIAIDESLYKAHIEPLLLLICDALTVVYYRPALVSMGYTPEQAARVVIWYDPSEILTKPDPSEAANNGWDRGAISDESWRRQNGFTDADAPSDEELVRRAIIKAGVPAPDVVTALYRALAPELMKNVTDVNQATNPAPLSPRAQEILNGAPEDDTDSSDSSDSDSGDADGTPPPPAVPGATAPPSPGDSQ